MKYDVKKDIFCPGGSVRRVKEAKDLKDAETKRWASKAPSRLWL
jgi:hypothetical protein